MKCTVVIPVGPGHKELAERAVASVKRACDYDMGPFDSVISSMALDVDGKYGRSAARNVAMEEQPADWFFMLDADDEMVFDALSWIDRRFCATFGAVCLNGKVSDNNVYPCTHKTLLEKGSKGTLSMGCFVNGDLGIQFDESLDVGEDFDFYMRLPDFIKVSAPLVDIGYDQPSAGGPRGYKRCTWQQTCNEIIERYLESTLTQH